MLNGNLVFLRAVEPSDIDHLFLWENDPEIWHISNTTEPFSRFKLEQYVLSTDQDIFSSRQLRLIICLKENNQPIGSVDLFDFDPINHRAGIGILLDAASRGKGLASESLDLFIHYCFEVLQLHQLYCNILPSNQPSLDLFQKKGFFKSGIKKDWVFINNNWCDELLFQLINPDK